MFKPNHAKKYKALGINIYGGGFTLGAMKHFDVLGQWEECNLGRKTFDLNFDDIPRPLNLEDWPIDEFRGKLDFIFANPPCAPWSVANNHKGKTRESRFEDWRLLLTKHTMETAVQLRPKIFICESVENAYNIGKSHYDQYVKLWMDAGYSVTYFLTDAIIHGSPSARRRFHFIAHKYEIFLKPPSMKNFEPNTVRKQIGDIEHRSTFGTIAQHNLIPCPYSKYFKIVPPGGSLRRTVMDKKLVPNYDGPGIGFFHKRFVYDSPSCTMVGFLWIHPNGKRWVTFRESMRMCTYPDTFLAHNPVEAVDAVIPIISTMLSFEAKKSIRRREVRRKKFEVVDWRPLGHQYHMEFMKHKVLGRGKAKY